MLVTVKHIVEMCRECPHASNNAQEHDNPFTSGPAELHWYCNQGKHTRNSVYIKDERKMAPACPLKRRGKAYGK